MDFWTQKVFDRLRKHADNGPALFTISREDAQRILAYTRDMENREDTRMREPAPQN